MTGGYRREIDGLRALAVLAVVAFHARIPGFSGGFAGVDIFLVISGYLIGGLILREADAGRFSLLGFYERRVRRILPALLAMLAFTALAGWILLPGDFRSFGASLAAISAFASNFLFERGTGYFSLTEEATPLLHTWSLAVEEQFYLFFPLALLLARRWNLQRIALIGATLLSFAYSVWATRADPAMAFYSPASRAWEFLAGALLAANLLRRPTRDIGDGAALIGLALLAFALFTLKETAPFPGLNALAPVLGSALLLYGTQPEGSRAAKLLSLKPLVAIGLISYSLYLWHWPLIVLGGYYVLDHRALVITRIAMALLAFPVAWLSWRYIERPFRKPRLLLSRRTLFVGAAAASFALALYGAAIYALNGIPARFDPAVVRLADRGNQPDYGCTSKPIDTLLTDPACRIGDPSARPSFILWGDSHAAVYFPELRRQALAAGASGYNITTYGCPPLFEYQGDGASELRNRKLAECRERNARTVKLMAEMRPRAVVLAGNWGAYSGGKNAKHAIEGSNDLDRFEDGLFALRKLGITLYLVLDVPQTDRLSIQQLAKARAIGARSLLEPTTADYLRRTQAMRTRAVEWQRLGLIQLIEPASLLCGPVTCRMIADDYPLYFDSNHLNARGAAFVGPLFVPMIRSLSD